MRKLFEKYNSGDTEGFREVALKIIAEEQQKQNHSLAKDLLKILESNKSKKTYFKRIESEMDINDPLIDLKHSKKRLVDIILKDSVRIQINRILEEYSKLELLKAYNLKPKTKILLCGPPGCGKTLCSEVISSELKIPLLYTRFDAIISSYLGETSANLRKVFDYSKKGNFVILFDEFDAIGKNREDAQDHGELKRVVNSFLQILDNNESDSIIIAATNTPSRLDPAIWRRFDEIIFLSKPSVGEIKLLLKLKLKNFPIGRLNFDVLARRMINMSHSEIEWICFDAIKSSVLEGRKKLESSTIDNSIKKQKRMLKIKD